jgi:DNA-binding transcriptional ArsR family regulator
MGLEIALRALAEPRRWEILSLVRDHELSSGEIASHFDVTRPAISQHLGVLKAAGLLTERREGTKRLYRARPEGLEEVRSFVETFWDVSLHSLKREAETEEQRSSRYEIPGRN